MNYRHQADVCHAYQVVVKQHGVPKEQVVTMLYNDVVKSFFNTRRGTMFNEPGGADVYKDVAIDYSGKQITPKNFLAVLRGDEAAMRGVGSGRVVASGPADRVFVYFADHGAPGFLAFPSKLLVVPTQLYARDLIRTLTDMHGAQRYGQLLLYVEACDSGSIFNGLLPSNISALAVTAAGALEPSMACYYNNTLGTFLGDCFSNHWLEEQDAAPSPRETVGEQVTRVRAATDTSHVCVYGDTALARVPAAAFLGAPPAGAPTAGATRGVRRPAGAVSSRDVAVETLRRQLASALEGLGEEARAAVEAAAERADEDEGEEGGEGDGHAPPDDARARAARLARLLWREERARRAADRTFRALAEALVIHLSPGAAGRAAAIAELLEGPWAAAGGGGGDDARCHGVPRVERFDCLEAAVAGVTRACGALSDYSLRYAGVLQRACDAGLDAPHIVRAADGVCGAGKGSKGKGSKGNCNTVRPLPLSPWSHFHPRAPPRARRRGA
jgi:hypothetical protein